MTVSSGIAVIQKSNWEVWQKKVGKMTVVFRERTSRNLIGGMCQPCGVSERLRFVRAPQHEKKTRERAASSRPLCRVGRGNLSQPFLFVSPGSATPGPQPSLDNGGCGPPSALMENSNSKKSPRHNYNSTGGCLHRIRSSALHPNGSLEGLVPPIKPSGSR